MSKHKLLVVAQEIDPYIEGSELGKIVARLPQYAQDKGGFELRVLMPRFGCINERRHRLHEVVRLSGMNIIIDDDDYPLVIKVASMPNSRMQVYFLENEDYFKTKNVMTLEDGTPIEDNHERAIFFCKGALETVKKFGWAPDIIHCHGWLTGMLPAFVKKAYSHEPIFKHSRVIYSGYNHELKVALPENFLQKGAINGMNQEDLLPYALNNELAMDEGAIFYADGVIKGQQTLSESIEELFENLDKPTLDFIEEDNYLQAYVEFYNHVLAESVVE